MKKTKNVKVNEEKEILVPIVNSLKNKIILHILASEEGAFKKFLEEEKWINNVIYILMKIKPLYNISKGLFFGF